MDYIIANNLLPGNECIVTLKIVPRIIGKNIEKSNESDANTKRNCESDAAKIIKDLKPKKCPNCGGPVRVDRSSPYKY